MTVRLIWACVADLGARNNSSGLAALLGGAIVFMGSGATAGAPGNAVDVDVCGLDQYGQPELVFTASPAIATLAPVFAAFVRWHDAPSLASSRGRVRCQREFARLARRPQNP